MPDPNWRNRTLFHGDNLDFLRGMNSGSVHLIATDPPFNKGRDFHATPDSLAAGARFQDRWSWSNDVEGAWIDQMQDDWPAVWEVIDAARAAWGDDMAAFLCFMGVRVIEMRRVLRDDGSLYLHCDPTASHYLKALLDAVFGRRQFRNEIVWRRYDRPKGSQHKSQRFGRSSDAILFYAKSEHVRFNANAVRRPLTETEIAKRFSSKDAKGRFMSGPLIRGVSMGERPNLVFPFQGYTPGPAGWRMERDKLQAIVDRGDFYFTSNGIPRRKFRPGDAAGAMVDNVWTDIGPLGAQDQERTGYPTQKPLALYERIVAASSTPGDIVLDPFAGCATTPVAAERQGRQWVAMDIWEGAADIVRQRLADNRQLLTDADPQIHYETEPPERTDAGDDAAPFLQVTERYAEPNGPRMSRAEMYDFLLAQHGPKCQGCDWIAHDPRHLELDHNTPRSDGGLNHITNRILLCGPCNRLKSNTYTLSGLRRQNAKLGYMAQ